MFHASMPPSSEVTFLNPEDRSWDVTAADRRPISQTMRMALDPEAMKREGSDRRSSADTATEPGMVGVDTACGRISNTESNSVPMASIGPMLGGMSFMGWKARPYASRECACRVGSSE